MANLVVLHWDRTPTNTYTFGSLIGYHRDSSVTFSNTRQSPGTPIYYWRNRPNDVRTRAYDQVPLLARGATYAFHVDARIEPAASVMVNVAFLDENDQIISEHLEQGLDGEFTMPEEAVAYRLELLNINNQKLHFYACYLSQADTMRTLTMTEVLPSRLLHVHDDAKPAGRQITVLRQRQPSEWLDLTPVADQYFLRIPAYQLTQPEAIRELAQQAYQALHLDSASQLHWRVMTSEAENALEICQEVFENPK